MGEVTMVGLTVAPVLAQGGSAHVIVESVWS